jgi:transposase
MRQVHRAGEKAFVDYSGKRLHYTDPQTGERIEVELFVGVLGASSYTFAEATRTQTLPDWCGSHVRMLEYFGGVPTVLVPDQLRSAVREPCRYDPAINRSYEQLAHHYQTAVVPARPRKPKDKAKVERAVQVAQRWILARLRHEQFFSLAELNVRIREYLDELNARPMRRYGGQSRRELLERLDAPALSPLPDRSYEYAEWSKARVNVDYHIEVDGHYYSVPYALAREVVDVCLTAATVQVLHRHRLVATHARSRDAHRHTTLPAHMPDDHRAWLKADPASVCSWARSVGPMTEAMVAQLLQSRPFAQQGLRSAMGLMRVGKQHEAARVEAACAKALRFGARSYRPVASMLRHGREQDEPIEEPSRTIQHGNVRGPDYFN